MNVVRLLFDYTDTQRFDSPLSLDEAIDRLSKKAHKQTLKMRIASDVEQSTLVGSVTKKAVALHRVQPFVGNMFKPHFYGEFKSKDGRALLEGRFTMAPFAKFTVCGFFLCIAFAELFMLPLMFSPSSHLLFVFPLGIAALLLGFVYFGKWVGRDDPRWISKAVSDCLSAI
jgi:hypothetical protein